MRIERDRQDAIRIARTKIELKPLYLDTETTGLGDLDEIVEISILDYDGSVLFDSLVRPLRKIQADAMAIHGITEAMVKDAPRWGEVWPEIKTILHNRTIAIYNADFDIRMIRQTHRVHQISSTQIPNDYFCIMLLYAQFYGEWDYTRRSFRWQSLEKAGMQCRIPLSNTHRAKDDAALARAVLHFIAESG
jgi:DNA polymerase-3 subunit epsilon